MTKIKAKAKSQKKEIKLSNYDEMKTVKEKVDGIKPENTIVLTNTPSTIVGAIWYE